MFYQYTETGMVQIPPEAVVSSCLTAGYIRAEELEAISPLFGFDKSTVDACKNARQLFCSGVEVYEDNTFTELRILNGSDKDEDYIALYLKKNLILVVDIEDADGSTKEKYLSAIKRYPPTHVSCEKILYAFLELLLKGDYTALETIGNDLSDQEEILLEKDPDNDFNIRLLEIKKQLSKRHYYYEQLLDITHAVSENDNDIFDTDNLIYIDNVEKQITRLRENTNNLISTVEHLQDAYSSWLDIKMNNTMKIFTILTSIFFPLTIIVGWYGMNFQSMPEFTWKYGYLYVILLSIATVVVLALIGKRKKWF